MNSLGLLPRLTATPRRQAGALTALTGVLLVAFFIAPNALARSSVNTGNVSDTFRRGMVAYWGSGREGFPGQLDATVSFWFRFHVVKAGVSALLLATVVALGVVLWRQARQRTGGRVGRLSVVAPGAVVTLLGLFALVALVANVQGAAAPFASLLPMLTGGGTDRALDGTLTDVRRQLADYPAGQHSPALTVMVNDFAVYHAVLAAMAALVALAAAVGCVLLWRRSRAAADARSKRTMTFGVAAGAAMTLIVLVIAFANASSAAHSPQALADFFAGGW
ncbi:tat (twin-arginine translocation) pathway signal sequence [Streptomyces sp. NPDC008317]|uniref:tat (twin-arginine translocation) pathway signal sequence n=1 Tax=Streptomyces sp. NPDC008317 TaxID=3364827 RepID=UPI0036E69734